MDKYKVVALIGEGSFGRVFKGYDKDKPEHSLALKLVPKVNKVEADIRALRRECKIQRQLDHENIVSAIESFETDNELVLVTEFIDGGNLASLMKNFPEGLDDKSIKNLAVDLFCALHYLHGQRVLHRDLKPQNVLLDKATGRAKLADFGFARNLGAETLVLTSIKGTPLYMAPELIEERPYDFKVDLWSAGGILYEAAFGNPPFATNSLLSLIEKIYFHSIPWPSKEKPCMPFLEGLLRKDPKKRFDWNDILNHSYFSDEKRIKECQEKALEFTKALTESQELVKEIQRQDKAKKLPGRSQTLITIAQRYEDQKKRLEQMQQQQNHNSGRRYSDLLAYQSPQIVRPTPTKRRNSDVAFHTTAKEDLSFNNEEWMQFLDAQLVDYDPQSVNANDLIMLLKPLQTTKASSEVILKTVTILALPFSQPEQPPSKEIFLAYKSAKVVEKIQQGLDNIGVKDVPSVRALLLLLTRLCYMKDTDFYKEVDLPLIFSILSMMDHDVQAYCLDICIKLVQTNPSSEVLVNHEQVFKVIQSHPKKALILLSMLPTRRKELKIWLANNKMPPANCDEKLKQLCNKFLYL